MSDDTKLGERAQPLEVPIVDCADFEDSVGAHDHAVALGFASAVVDDGVPGSRRCVATFSRTIRVLCGAALFGQLLLSLSHSGPALARTHCFDPIVPEHRLGVKRATPVLLRVTASDHTADMSATGTLIAESLSRDRPFEGVAIQVRKISRADVGDVNAGQPLTWTLIEFEAEDEVLGDLAKALSLSLNASGGWYCDFRTDVETFVVFSGRSFRYLRGEGEGRAEAEAYGRSVGVPEVQLDWPA